VNLGLATIRAGCVGKLFSSQAQSIISIVMNTPFGNGNGAVVERSLGQLGKPSRRFGISDLKLDDSATGLIPFLTLKPMPVLSSLLPSTTLLVQ